MKKFNLSKTAKNLKAGFIKHSPEILTGIGIAGMLSSTIMAVKATPKALDIIAEIKGEKLGKKEETKKIVKKVAPIYIPTVITTGLSIACIVGASSINHRRNAALATAYSLSESTLKEYQQKVIETIGPKKEEEIQQKIAQDHVDKHPIENHQVYMNKKNDILFYLDLSGEDDANPFKETGFYFMHDLNDMYKIQDLLNRRLRSEMYLSVDEVLYEFGIPSCDFWYGQGFNCNDYEFDFAGRYRLTVSKDDRPCYAFSLKPKPRFGYGDLS